MKSGTRTYTGFGISLLVVWAIVLVAVTLIDPANTRYAVWLVFLGYVIGWLFATLARRLDPSRHES